MKASLSRHKGIFPVSGPLYLARQLQSVTFRTCLLTVLSRYLRRSERTAFVALKLSFSMLKAVLFRYESIRLQSVSLRSVSSMSG